VARLVPILLALTAILTLAIAVVWFTFRSTRTAEGITR